MARKLQSTMRRLRVGAAYARETIVGGGNLRESVLLSLLKHHYRSRFRREWCLGSEKPHFTNHRSGAFRLAYEDETLGAYPFYRGFFSSEVVSEGDRLLDIGCGDGFFTKRFLSLKCRHVDAIDVEPTAIRAAASYHHAENITYQVRDAVSKPFPADSYDVVVWDGAIGHFSAEVTNQMLAKIGAVLASDGIFVGSETLGNIEGHDHLQYFDSLDDLSRLLQPHFRYVQLRTVNYQLFGFVRTEAYWRCANDRQRIEECAWQDHAAVTFGAANVNTLHRQGA